MLQHFARQHDYSSLTPAWRAPSAFSTTGGGLGGAGGGSLMSPGLCHMQILHPKPLQGEAQTSTLLGLSQQSVKWGFADTANAPLPDPGAQLWGHLTCRQQQGCPSWTPSFPLRMWDALRISPQHCCHHRGARAGQTGDGGERHRNTESKIKGGGEN